MTPHTPATMPTPSKPSPRLAAAVARAALVLWLAAAALGGTACGGASGAAPVEYLDDRAALDFGPSFAGIDRRDEAYLAWFEGRTDDALRILDADEREADPLARFVRAEIALQRGEYVHAAQHHAALVVAAPSHALSRIAVRRLARLVDMVGDPQPIAAILVPPTWQAAGAEERLVLARIAATLAERAALVAGEPLPGWQAYGGLEHWRWVGPFDLFDQAGFARPYAPESEAALGERYRSPDGLRDLVTREASFGGQLAPPVMQTGIYYLESWVELAAPTELAVSLRGARQAALWIDGEPVLTRDDDAGVPADESARLVMLSKGRHRVLVKLGVGSSATAQLMLVPTKGAPPFALAAAEPGTVTGTAEPGLNLRLRAGLPEDLAEIASDPFYLWLATLVASETSEHARGLAAVDLALPQAETFVPLALAEAELVRTDPGLEPTIGLNLATDAWRRALELDPQSGHAQLMLGYLLYERGQYEKALEQLDAFVAAVPQEFRGHFHRYLTLSAVGWDRAAEQALASALATSPQSCELAVAAIDGEAARSRYPTPDTVPTDVVHCPGVREAMVRYHHLPRGELDEALAIYTRLVEQFPDDAGYRLSLGSLLAQAGRVDEAIAAYAKADELIGLDSSLYVAERVDLLIATGRETEARALLEDELAKSPAQLELVELMRGFGGERVLADLRVDGLAVVKDYLDDETRNYTQSAFYLLDYAAFRYFKDGSSLSVTHQITRVLNKDAKNRLGEVQVPPGAIVTQLRTIKSDGHTTVEPEFIANKPTISMPNLEVGDFIEFEYITASGPRVQGESGFVVPRWYFQIFEAPLMYSELVVEIPAGLDPVLDVRGSVPQPEVSSAGDGRFERYRWLMTEMLDPRPEPGAPSMLEIVPSVQLAAGVDGEQVRRSMRNAVMSSTRPTTRLRDAALVAAGGAAEPREIARRMFKFVKAEITDTEEAFAVPASWVWTARQGSRLTLLKALLDQAGVPADVVLVKPFGAPETDSPVGDWSGYSEIVLRVDVGEERPLWLDPSQTWARFDYVDPLLQGQPGVVLGESEAETVVVHDYDDEIDRTVMSFDLVLAADGSISGQARETSDGVAGTGLRNFISRFSSDPTEVMERLAGYLGPSFGLANVTDYEFFGFDEEGAVSVSFAFDALDFAEVDDDGSLVVQSALFPSELSNNYAQLPARQQALVIAHPLHSEIQLGLTVPTGMALAELPTEHRIDSPFGSYTRTVEASEGTLRLVERLDVPRQRIAPADYEAFREFAHRVDLAQSIRLAVR